MLPELEEHIMPAEYEETIIFGPHPGMSVFQVINALRYFNKDTILREELENDNLESYLQNSLSLAIEKIFDKHKNVVQKCGSSGIDFSNTKTVLEKSTSEKTANIGQKINLRSHGNLSLQDNHFNSGFLSSSSPEGTPMKLLCEGITKLHTDKNNTEKSDQDKDSQSTHCAKEGIDMSPLFMLMSILPEPAASFCKQVMDRDQLAWRISLYHVVIVFLNWGATIKSLGLEDIFESDIISPLLPPHYIPCETSEESFPTSANVRLVLSAVAQRLPSDSEMSFRGRTLLLRVLVFAAMDNLQRHNLTFFCRTVRSILGSFCDWNDEKAAVIVNDLKLKFMDPYNSEYVCSCVFNLFDNRLHQVGMLACYNVLYDQFHVQSEPSLSSLVLHLASPPDLLLRYEQWELFIMSRLIHSLLVRHAENTESCPREAVEKLDHWTTDVRNALKMPPYIYNLQSGYVRERLSRLSRECNGAMCSP